MTVELRLLSRVSFRGEDVTSPRLRDLLALLADEHRSGVSVARLVEGLWPGERPENPAKALQVVVSRARSRLGADVVVHTPTGYRLGLDETRVDASAVLLAASAGVRGLRDGDHRDALAHADRGLALWDGPPDPDARDDPLSSLRADRASAYRTLLRVRGLALARLGRHAEGFEALTAVARDRPRDEEVLADLLRCEAATAGPSAALARYEDYRRSLRDELGTDPGAALQAVQRDLLRDEATPVRHGVAHEPNALLGRDADLAAVLDLMRTSRVTSIVGTGGLGKTRLAHAVARAAPQRSVRFVALAGVARDGDVAAEVASALGVGPGQRSGPAPRAPGRPGEAPSVIAEALGPGPALLVLDNCEHVVEEVAALVGALVSMTRDVRVLTTSRAPLGLSSESVYPLPALDPPTAAELFRLRARAARPDADVPADAVRELCRRLDGLPLAVELAAARIRVMSVPEIARGLDDRFALLRARTRDAPSRHRTMHAVVEWSWNLLSPSGREAMRLLSVFSSGFTADAARHLLGDGDAVEVLEDLVDQSLLNTAEDGSGTRFRMLETVREFSAARREAEGETDRAVAGLLAWARAFGGEHYESVFSADPSGGAERVRAEQDNLLQALRHALDRRDGPAVAAVTAVLACLWTLDADYGRLLTLAEETAGPLSRLRPGPEDVEVTRTALTMVALTSLMLKDPRSTRAIVALRRLPPAAPDTLLRAMATVIASIPEILDPARSPGGTPVLDRLRAAEEPLLAAVADCVAGYILEREGDVEGAYTATAAMTPVAEAGGPPVLGVLVHSRLSELLMQLDRAAEARDHLRRALDLLDVHHWPDPFGMRWALAAVGLQLGEYDEAERWLDRALADGSDDDYGTAAYHLGARAEIALGRGDVETGLALWRRAVRRLADDEKPMSDAVPDPWALESHCVAVVAHARHGRLDLVADLAAGLPGALSALLDDPRVAAPSFFMDLPACGGLLLALATAALTGPSPGVRPLAARAIALAERLHYFRSFQPTMAPEAARRAAEDADRAAYRAAVLEFASLGRDELRDAARRIGRELAASAAPSG